ARDIGGYDSGEAALLDHSGSPTNLNGPTRASRSARRLYGSPLAQRPTENFGCPASRSLAIDCASAVLPRFQRAAIRVVCALSHRLWLFRTRRLMSRAAATSPR